MLEISNLMHLCFIRGRSACCYSRQHFHPGLEKVSNSLMLQDTVAVRQGVVLPLLYHKIYEGWALVFSPVHHISHIIHPGLLINRSSIMPTYYKLSGGYPTLHHRLVTVVSTTSFVHIVPSLLFGCCFLHSELSFMLIQSPFTNDLPQKTSQTCFLTTVLVYNVPRIDNHHDLLPVSLICIPRTYSKLPKLEKNKVL